MKWIYTLHAPWIEEQTSTGQPAQTAYLRPTIFNEQGEKMVGNIVEIMVIGLEFYFGNPQDMLDDDEARQIYFEELANKEYHVLHRDVNQEEHYRMAMVDVYLKKEGFTKEEFFDWVRSVFSINGYPLDELEEGSPEDFLDMNPLMRMFTDENIKKSEKLFGDKWWEKDEGEEGEGKTE